MSKCRYEPWASEHKQDWAQRHAALAKGERRLLWTDEEIRGEVPATREYAERARGPNDNALPDVSVHTWDSCALPWYRTHVAQPAQSRLAMEFRADGCPALADLIDAERETIRFLPPEDG